jgi:ABC-type transporter Mla subunit MlaD
MKKVDSWTATYEDFLVCSERFTEELDRFQDGIRESKSVLAQAGQFVAHVDAASKKIVQQVSDAERAWANADQMALDAATKAHEAAFQGVQTSLDGVTKALVKSVRANQDAASQVHQSFSHSRRVVVGLGFGFVLISGLAIFAAVYLANTRESPLELNIRQDAARFELIWNKATPKEKAILQKIWSRPPAAS